MAAWRGRFRAIINRGYRAGGLGDGSGVAGLAVAEEACSLVATGNRDGRSDWISRDRRAADIDSGGRACDRNPGSIDHVHPRLEIKKLPEAADAEPLVDFAGRSSGISDKIRKNLP